jgi:hypothetical protein
MVVASLLELAGGATTGVEPIRMISKMVWVARVVVTAWPEVV